MKEKLHILVWRIIKLSPVFRYIWRGFLTELMFDLERFDMEPEAVKSKYLAKLRKAEAPTR